MLPSHPRLCDRDSGTESCDRESGTESVCDSGTNADSMRHDCIRVISSCSYSQTPESITVVVLVVLGSAADISSLIRVLEFSCLRFLLLLFFLQHRISSRSFCNQAKRITHIRHHKQERDYL